MNPLIGISCSLGQAACSLSQAHSSQLQHRLNDSYIRAVTEAGGIPVLLPNNADLSGLDTLVEKLDGFLLSGGDDIDPAYFGERANEKLGTIVPQRDRFELALARKVLETTHKPLLGICRGLQVMNVAMGGSLYQDLTSAGFPSHSLSMYPRNEVTHGIQILPGTRLAQIMGDGTGRVNSFHHQAIKKLADGFVCAARSLPDDLIEAIEVQGDRFAVGVQWHPEELTEREEAKALICQFILAAQNG